MCRVLNSIWSGRPASDMQVDTGRWQRTNAGELVDEYADRQAGRQAGKQASTSVTRQTTFAQTDRPTHPPAVTIGTCAWAPKPIAAKGTAVVMQGVAEPIYMSQPLQLYPLLHQQPTSAFVGSAWRAQAMADMACVSSSFSACTVPSRRHASTLSGLR